MSFNCSLCFEPSIGMLTIADKDPICLECIDDYIVPKFHQALDQESSFPVLWGSTRLEPSQFVDWLGSTFVQRYARRRQEYDCNDRIYCPHVIIKAVAPPIGEIANGRLALTSTQQANFPSQAIEPCGGFVTQRSARPGVVACSRCLGPVASCCGSILEDASANHACSLQDAHDPLVKLTRGKDYQVCPKCSRHQALASGCNQINCHSCGGSYCYICGSAAEEGSGHWNAGSTCSRYNHPDDRNAQFDEPSNDEFLEEDFPDENGMPFAHIWTLGGVDQEVSFPFARFQQAVRQHFDDIAVDDGDTPEHPNWSDENYVLTSDIEVAFNIQRSDVSLTDVYPLNGLDPNNSTLRGLLNRVWREIEISFDGRETRLTVIVESLLPRPRHATL